MEFRRTTVKANFCPTCGKNLSVYGVLFNGTKYQVKLCWKDGFFNITPDDMNEFTFMILENPMLILDMIKEKILKPVKQKQ